MALIRTKTHKLKKGMLIKEDVHNRSGVVLVPENTEVTIEVFELLTKHFIDEVVIDYKAEPAPITDLTVRRRQLTPKRRQEFAKSYQIAEKTLSHNLKDIVLKDKEVDIPALLGLLQTDEVLHLYKKI